jgi:hypothetical protein
MSGRAVPLQKAMDWSFKRSNTNFWVATIDNERVDAPVK